MKRVMADIETLDLGPRSVILSIGVVLFDEKEDHEAYRFVLPISEQLAKGRTISESTLQFWMGQPREVWNRQRASAWSSLKDSLIMFAQVVESPDELWSQGMFDIVNLESLFKDVGLTVPWSYKAVRDLRTLRKLLPEEFDKTVPVGSAHDCVDDCRYQTAVWRSAMKALRGE